MAWLHICLLRQPEFSPKQIGSNRPTPQRHLIPWRFAVSRALTRFPVHAPSTLAVATIKCHRVVASYQGLSNILVGCTPSAHRDSVGTLLHRALQRHLQQHHPFPLRCMIRRRTGRAAEAEGRSERELALHTLHRELPGYHRETSRRAHGPQGAPADARHGNVGDLEDRHDWWCGGARCGRVVGIRGKNKQRDGEEQTSPICPAPTHDTLPEKT